MSCAVSNNIPYLGTYAWNGKKSYNGGFGAGMPEYAGAANLAVRLVNMKNDMSLLADELVDELATGDNIRIMTPLQV